MHFYGVRQPILAAFTPSMSQLYPGKLESFSKPRSKWSDSFIVVPRDNNSNSTLQHTYRMCGAEISQVRSLLDFTLERNRRDTCTRSWSVTPGGAHQMRLGFPLCCVICYSEGKLRLSLLLQVTAMETAQTIAPLPAVSRCHPCKRSYALASYPRASLD